MLLTKLANQEVINFLRTATIKNSFFADQLLKALVNPQYQEIIPARLNPYYLHLTGQYILKSEMHTWITDPSTGVRVPQAYAASQSFLDSNGNSVTIDNSRIYDYSAFDEMMYVTSLDTRDEIPFTREVLHGCGGNTSIHKKTLEAYKVGGRYFNLLCEKYPKQVDLIKSIVYLVPEKELSEDEKSSYGSSIPSSDDLRMLNVLDAQHLELVNCDSSILEEREKEDILSTVKSVLDIFRKRWSVKEYTYEDNYASVMWSVLWSILPMAMIVQRYANIKGPNVHSSHVWDYLTAHGLDSYRGYLTQEQEAFLYKNINYLRLHGGEHRILNILVDNLLSAYNLHIESKSVVIDSTNSLNVDTVGTGYDTQCSRCARKSVCFKNITTYRCNDFIGTKETCKPTSVILSEELPGARKDRILSLLKSRYSCTDEEANRRYERSFMWKDDAIEKIKDELDRDQTTARDQVTDTLANTINEEYLSGLEPVYGQDVVDAQHAELRHARSAVIPTKLLEIVEDPTEPKYEEMFTRFLTDTLFHLAPRYENGVYKKYVDESFKVLIGQEAVQINLTYGEMLAAMYLGFLKEFKPNLVIDTKNAVTVSGTSIVDGRTVLTDFNNYATFDFKVPSEAVISTAFKFGKPVRQRELYEAAKSGGYVKVDVAEVDVPVRGKRYYIIKNARYAYAGDITEFSSSKTYYTKLSEEGTYLETEDSVKLPKKTYYTRSLTGYVEFTGASFSSDTSYYEFITLPELMTNAPSGTDVLFVKINDCIYAVTSKEATSSDYEWVDTFDTVYTILGRFDLRFGSYIYHENNNEIAVIPEYFRWNYAHLGVPSARSMAELKYVPMEVGDYGYVWGVNPSVVLLGVDGLDSATKPSHFSKGAYTKHKSDLTGDYVAVESVEVYEQNRVEMLGDESYRYLSMISSDPVNGVWNVVTDPDTGATIELEKITANVTMYYDTDLEYECELVKLDKLIDVDYLIDSMYVDAMNGFTNSEELGNYIAKMFVIAEKLDMMSSSCGDIKTRAAIKVIVDKITVPRSKRDFRLLSSEALSDPTYTDWFNVAPDIGDMIKKIDDTDDASVMWNEFNLQIFSSLLKYCDLAYASSATSKTKYMKLKELVKSLSSYLVNYIDNQGSSYSGTEISHIMCDSTGSKLSFTSYVNFDLTRQTFNYDRIGDFNRYYDATLDKEVDRYLYLPATETTAKSGVKYYKYSLLGDDSLSDNYIFVEDNVEVGDDLTGYQRYFRVNLREELGIPVDKVFRIIHSGGSWYYQVGSDITVETEVETYDNDAEVSRVMSCNVSGDLTKMTGTTDMKISRSYKTVVEDSISWESILPVDSKVAEYLRIMTMSYHKTSVSKFVFEPEEVKPYVTPDMADYMLLSSEMTETPYPSQTTKES